MKNLLEPIIKNAVIKILTINKLGIDDLSIQLDIPKVNNFGDYTTNIAMLLASKLSKKPVEIAKSIIDNLDDPTKIIKKIEIAGPGFINIFINPQNWLYILREIETKGNKFGCSDIGNGRKINIEFVSANPTGPLHIGHARGAVVGDVLANLFKACGFEVVKEYYINDAGNQMRTLGLSCLIRYKQRLGQKIPFLENGYKGDYIIDIAQEIINQHGDKFINLPDEEALKFFTEFSSKYILDGIQADLQRFGVIFDKWFSEKSLYASGEVQKTIEWLKKAGYAYEQDQAIWIKTSSFGDEKDRVIVRQNGEPTYYASDISYHLYKFSQSYDLLINLWGVDHHGYVNRIKAIINALGYDQEKLKILLIQFVNLLRHGQKVAMSTRSGEFHTLAEVLDEVGNDPVRFSFLTRRCDSHLDFDLEVAKKQSMENPVYYVQYAHARISSILREASERNITVANSNEIDISLLSLPEEIEISKHLSLFPELVKSSATLFEPHRLTFYLQDLAALFHKYYNHHKVISSDIKLTQARLFFVTVLKTVLQNALLLLGIVPQEKM